MDDSIAPTSDVPQGGDPIAAYRRYLEANTGDRLSGAGSQVDDDLSALAQPPGAAPSIAPVEQGPPPGAGPSVAPPPPQAAPQAGGIAPVGQSGGSYSDTPTIDSIMPNPLTQDQGPAPLAAQTDQAPKAKKAAKMKGAANASQADQAPTIEGGPQGANPDLGDAQNMTPASGHIIPGKKTPDGKPLINVQPPDHDPNDLDPEKLKNAHTIDDVFDALPKSKQSTYMDWWEEQHGDINQRYDQMRQDLGQRPDPNRDPTRKEKFTMLMNFGLNLLQNNRRGQGPGGTGTDPFAALGASAQEAIGTQKAKQQQQTQDYDARTAGIEAQRQNQLKDIGNYGQAVREDALITNANTRTTLEAIKYLKPPKTGQPTTRVLSNGTQVDYDPDTKSWNPSVDKDGNPIGKMPQQGPRGGGASKSPARMAEYHDLVDNQHVEPNRALALVYGSGGVKSSDPTKTYNSIYSKARSLYESPEDAAAEAEHMTGVLHGENWRDQQSSARAPAIAPKAPAQPPPPGKIGVDAQGNRWRNVNGQAVLVPK